MSAPRQRSAEWSVSSASTSVRWYADSSSSGDSNSSEKVRSASLWRLASAVVTEESKPPLKYAPTGTSARMRMRVASASSASTSSPFSFSVALTRSLRDGKLSCQ